MYIDEKKLKRQEGQVQKWIAEFNCTGTLEACTGYGKTYVAILAIKRLHKKYPNAFIDVIVPKIPLLEDWIRPKTGHIATHGLNNIEVFVVNSYIRLGVRDISLLIADEIHNYASEEFIKTFQVAGCVKKVDWKKGDTMILGLSATLERLDGKHTLIEEYCPIFDTVTMDEARREGYISDFRIYNLGLEFTKEDRVEYERWEDIFKNAFGKFERNFELALACCKGKYVKSELTIPVPKKDENGNLIKDQLGNIITVNRNVIKSTYEWQQWYSQRQEWDGEQGSFWSPESISKYAQQFMTSMRNRKTFIYEAGCKFESVIYLVKKFMVKTMIFSETSKFADRVTAELTEEVCMSYHTKIESRVITVEVIDKKGRVSSKPKKLGKDKVKQLILEDFKKPDGILAISSIRSLKEGFDYDGVRLIIMASYNSSKREDIQTKGRGTRLDYANLDKTAIIINLYIKDSQEQKWLKEKQRGTQGIIWTDNIDEITNQNDLFNIEMA